MNNYLWNHYLTEQRTKVYDWAGKDVGEPNDKVLSDYLNLELIKVLQKFKPNGRLLDVGCGIGTYVRYFNKLGYEAEGLTISQIHAKQGLKQGLLLHYGDAHDSKLRGGHYDVIWSSHVIEHMLSPVIMLREMNRLLKVGGYLVFQTPTNNSFYAYYPSHYTCFTKEQLFHLLVNHSGFKIVVLRRPKFSNDEAKNFSDEWEVIAQKVKDWEPLLYYDDSKEKIFNVYNLKMDDEVVK